MGRIEERIRRLDDLLPRPEPEVRHLMKIVHEDAYGAVRTVTVHELDRPRGVDRVLFHFAPGEPQEAEYEAFLAKGEPWDILAIRVVNTRPERPLLEERGGSAGVLEAEGPEAAPEPAPCAMEDDTALEAASEEELQAELGRLRGQKAALISERDYGKPS